MQVRDGAELRPAAAWEISYPLVLVLPGLNATKSGFRIEKSQSLRKCLRPRFIYGTGHQQPMCFLYTTMHPSSPNGKTCLVNSLRLLHQLLHLEVLHVTPGEHPHQLALTTTGLATKVVEALHGTNQPGRLGGRNPPIRHDLAMHQDQTLVIGQIQVMRDSSVWLRERTMHLECAEISKDHSRGMAVDCLL